MNHHLYSCESCINPIYYLITCTHVKNIVIFQHKDRHIHAWYPITMYFDGSYLLLDNKGVSLVTIRLETSRRNTFTVTLCYHLCNYCKFSKMIAKLRFFFFFFFLILEFPEFNNGSESLEIIKKSSDHGKVFITWEDNIIHENFNI